MINQATNNIVNKIHTIREFNAMMSREGKK